MRINFEIFSTLSPRTHITPPTNPVSTPETLLPTLPKNWKIMSHPTNYAPSLAAWEMLTLLIPLPLTSATAPAVDYRGRLLLNMINSLEIVSINANGHFSVPLSTHTPYAFSQKPNTHSILNYNLIAKHHVPLIQTCELLLTLSPLVSQPICPSTSTSTCPPHPPLPLRLLLNPFPFAPRTTLNALKTRRQRKHSLKHELKICPGSHPSSRNCTPNSKEEKSLHTLLQTKQTLDANLEFAVSAQDCGEDVFIAVRRAASG